MRRSLTSRRAALLVLALGLSAGTLPTAGAQAQAGCLGLDDAMRLAAERAPEVDIAEARLDMAQADLREARSLRRPQVSAFGRSAAGDSGLTSSQIENQVGVQVSQRLLDFGDARLAREAAAGSVQQREFEIRSQQLDSAGIVAEAYLTHLESLAMMDVVAERRSYFARQQEAVSELLLSGGATRADKAQIDAQMASAEADAMELRFRADRAATRIREYTGLPAHDLCPGAAAGADLDRALNGLGTLDEMMHAALTENPQIGARRGAIRSLEAQRDRERRNRLPVIEAVGILSYVHDDTRQDWETRDRLGIDVSVPLFTGSALDARQDRARAELSLQENALRAQQRELSEQAEIGFRRAISLQAQLLRREAVAQSQAAYFEAISGEFDFGLGILPDLVDARLAFEDAQLGVIAARYALLRQQVELVRLTARLPVGQGRRAEP